jgi:hypothetical protein
MCTESNASRGANFIISNVAMLDKQTAAAVQEKTLDVVPANFYVRRKLDNNAELLRNSDNETVGISPFQENKLAEGEAFALQGLTVGWVNHATETDPATVNYARTVATFEAIYHGNLEISQNGKLMMIIPIKAISDRMQNDSSKVYNLEGVMKLFVPKQTISIKLITAEGQALPTNNNFLEVGLHGVATKYN